MVEGIVHPIFDVVVNAGLPCLSSPISRDHQRPRRTIKRKLVLMCESVIAWAVMKAECVMSGTFHPVATSLVMSDVFESLTTHISARVYIQDKSLRKLFTFVLLAGSILEVCPSRALQGIGRILARVA
jgi:hypothetical protein